MSDRYYTLLRRDLLTGPWWIEFGSYDLEDVQDEHECIRALYDDGSPDYTRMIVSGDTQAEIDEAVKCANLETTRASA